MTEPKSQCNCIDCNLPDVGIESLGYKPTIAELEKAIGTPDEMDILPNGEVRPKYPIIHTIESVSKPEQPNQNIILVKTIQGLTTCINNELEKLESEHISTKQMLIDKALEAINSFENNELYELQKAFE